jgi:hypothetical protein
LGSDGANDGGIDEMNRWFSNASSVDDSSIAPPPPPPVPPRVTVRFC